MNGATVHALTGLKQPSAKALIGCMRRVAGCCLLCLHQNPVAGYQTAFVDQIGQLNLRADIYGLDAAVLKLLRGNERLIADTPIPRNYSSSSKPVVARLPSRPTQGRQASYRQEDKREYRQRYGQEYGWSNGWGWNNGSGWNSGNRWNNSWNNGRSGNDSYAATPSANRNLGRNW